MVEDGHSPTSAEYPHRLLQQSPGVRGDTEDKVKEDGRSTLGPQGKPGAISENEVCGSGQGDFGGAPQHLRSEVNG